MLSRRFLVPIILIVSGIASARVALADSSQEATNFLNEFGQRAIAALKAPNIPDEELANRFRSIFEEGFDVPFIARSALGRFWVRASAEEQAQYIPLFEDYIVEIYSSQFQEYQIKAFTAQSARAEGDNSVEVFSDFVKPDGSAVKLQWTVANIDGVPKIRDVKVEGVSMIATYRDQFANEILQSDGRIAGLLDTLREKTASLRTQVAGHD